MTKEQAESLTSEILGIVDNYCNLDWAYDYKEMVDSIANTILDNI